MTALLWLTRDLRVHDQPALRDRPDYPEPIVDHLQARRQTLERHGERRHVHRLTTGPQTG